MRHKSSPFAILVDFLPLLMLFVAFFSADEILITWNSWIDKDYPGYTIAMISALIISVYYIVCYFGRIGA